MQHGYLARLDGYARRVDFVVLLLLRSSLQGKRFDSYPGSQDDCGSKYRHRRT